MTGRRDVKPVALIASRGMTESEYQDAVRVERLFGLMQVRWHTRKLAADLGLPVDCMEPPKDPQPRLPRWFDDRLDADAAEDAAEEIRAARVHQHYRLTIPSWLDPNAFIKISAV